MREETSYHFGSISRETAEQILLDQGAADGLFLVRDSSATDSVLSLCHNRRSGKLFVSFHSSRNEGKRNADIREAGVRHTSCQ